MTQEKIHSFALKWLQKYEDDNTPRRLLEEDFAPDCFDLGFEMDCGNSFEERYSFEAFRNPDAFSKVVAIILPLQLSYEFWHTAYIILWSQG